MNTLVSFAFDAVGLLSALLDALCHGVARGSTDLTALLITTACLLVIIGCHDLLVHRRLFPIAARRVFKITGIILLACIFAIQLGCKVTTLGPSRIKPAKERAHRVTLPQYLADQLASSSWLLVSADSRLAPQMWLLADWRMRPVSSITKVSAAPGRYHLKGNNLYLSHPKSGEAALRIIRERAWLVALRVIAAVSFFAWTLWLLARRVVPRLRVIGAQMLRDRALMLMPAGFALFFGAHQWRFIHQDERAQMVTSRDDDGYMLERLREIAVHKTMDPWQLDNKAYGSIAFHPYAILPFIAAHTGWTPPVWLLNTTVRGMKLIISLIALAAVWLLGTRHLGRTPALWAVALTGTNVGFLTYSSYPFYPDVMMALFSTLSLAFTLDLVTRWSARSFFLAVVFAAMSAAIKFLTALLLPFIAITAIIALWREHREKPGRTLGALLWHGAAAAVLGIAVFFFCNPFPGYNIEWIVPNYKSAGELYSATTSHMVSGAAATFTDWKRLGYSAGRDLTDLIAAVLSAFIALVIAARMILKRASTDAVMVKAGLLALFALVFQAWLFKSITLVEGIDQRLLLPVLPLVFLITVWGIDTWIIQLKPRPFILVAALVPLALRLENMSDFFKHFGRLPATSPVSDWLSAAAVPEHARIVTGLRSYFPPQYKQLYDGIWQPEPMRRWLYESYSIPSVYVENEAAFENYFSPAVRARGFASPAQDRMHAAGRDFYATLRCNEMTPLMLMQTGEEIVASNLATHPAVARFRAYANPYAFATNLAQSPAGTRQQWPAPVTVGIVHAAVTDPASAPVHARIENADGQTETLSMAPLGDEPQASRQRWLQLDPPRDVRSITLVSADGAQLDPKAVRELMIHPPVPIGMNSTRHYFSISSDDALIAWRPMSHPGVAIKAAQPKEIALVHKSDCHVTGLTLVLDAAPAGSCVARCTFLFAGGTRAEVQGAEHRSLSPDFVYFTSSCPPGKTVTRIECVIISTADATLRQIHVRATPREEMVR